MFDGTVSLDRPKSLRPSKYSMYICCLLCQTLIFFMMKKKTSRSHVECYACYVIVYTSLHMFYSLQHFSFYVQNVSYLVVT